MLCAVLCAFAVLLSLSLCRESLKFRLCCVFSLSGIFSIGCEHLKRLQAILEPFTVALVFLFVVVASLCRL